MKERLKNELKNLRSYLRNNGGILLCVIAVSLAVVWALQSTDTILEIPVIWLNNHRPPLLALLIFLAIIFVAAWRRTKHFWWKYRNSYYLNRANLNWVDGLIVGLIPIAIWLLFALPNLLGSEYFWCPVVALILYALTAYFTTNAADVRKLFRPTGETPNHPRWRHFFADEPIDGESKDIIGRGIFARALKENIYELSFRESFVMGLYGDWGEGKSSVLNLLKKEVKSENKILLYEFDPWFFANPDAITENFFRGLEDFLAQFYFIPRRIKAHFQLYPELLIKGFVGVSLNFGDHTDDRPAHLKKEIEKFLSQLGKRVLVVIDDVDRLQKDEMLAVFRLVKLTSEMKNLVFLLSFDPTVVGEVLGDIEGGAEAYIEKIVQLPIQLPMTDQSIIDKFLLYSYPESKSEIDKMFDAMTIDPTRRKEFDDDFIKLYQTTIHLLFPTFRSVKRYLNSVMFRLPFVEKEVFLYDFFIIELFQTFFPKIYADIKAHGWYYVSNWTLVTHALSPLPYDKTERTKAIKAHIEGVIGDDEDKDVITSLLEEIFPEVRGSLSSSRSWRMHTTPDDAEYRRKGRVAHPDCFQKYFMLGVREGIIPDAEFHDELKKWKGASLPETEIENSLFAKYQKTGKLVEFLERLKLFAGQIDLNLVLPLIRTLYKNCSRLSREGDLWSTEFDQAEGLIFRLLEDNAGIKPEEIHAILEEIVKHAACFDLASLIVMSCGETRTSSLYRVHDNVRVAELRDILEARLKEYFVKGKKDIFLEYRKEREFAFILYQWATRWGDKTQSHKAEATNYLMWVFRENPKELGYFLTTYAKPQLGNREKKVFDMNGFSTAFEVEKFGRRLSRGKSSAYSNQEEKEAVDLFMAAYKQWLKSKPPKPSAAGRAATKRYDVPMEWSGTQIADAIRNALVGHVTGEIDVQTNTDQLVLIIFGSSETKEQLEAVLNGVNFYEHGWNRGGVQGGGSLPTFSVSLTKK